MPQHELLACAQYGCFAFSCFEDFAIRAKSYAANSVWQQLNVLAHNLCRSFQLDTIAETKGISRKRTCTHLLNTIRTIRFRIINKAGRLVRVSGRNALRMATNSSTQTLFERIELALAS